MVIGVNNDSGKPLLLCISLIAQYTIILDGNESNIQFTG